MTPKVNTTSAPSEFSGFFPNASRALDLDREVRSRLSSSITYLVNELRNQVVIPDSLHSLLAALDRSSVPPVIYAAYADLVLAIENGDRSEAERLMQYMASAPCDTTGIKLLPFRADSSDEIERLYQRYVDTDEDAPLALVSLPESAEKRFRELFHVGLDMMDQGCPALSAEIRALLREVLIVGKSHDPKFEFDGASAFTLWGGIVLNGEGAKTALQVVQALAHESAHNLVFGLTMDHPLHETDRSKRFSSPLRADPRPMDGILHATFVIARMHYAVHELMKSGCLEDDIFEEAREAAVMHSRAFFRGLSTVEEHAKLTGFGRALFDHTRDYMASAEAR